jgi:hypothetical protein
MRWRFAHAGWGERSVDAVERPDDAGWNGQDAESGGVVVGRWPDGTAITDSDCRAPDDARALSTDARRYRRSLRWSRRRVKFAALAHRVSSPQVLIAGLLLAAIAASALALLLPAAR